MNGKAMRWALVGLLMVSLAATLGVPAGATTLDFSQTTGFKSSTGTEGALGGGGAVPLSGGLEFSTAVTAPPGAPLGDSGVPPDIWQYVGWGCTPGSGSPPANCANGGTVGNATNAAVPFGNANRSALQILGQFGQLTDANVGGFHNDGWVDITIINHQNNPISGNVLTGVEIHSFLRLGPSGVVVDPEFPAPHVVGINFTETLNFADVANCTVQPAPGAPINPFASNCDDFFSVAGINLDSLFIPAGTFNASDPDMLVDFRLDPRLGALVCDGTASQPLACLGYPGPAIIVYTDETNIHALAVQAHLRVQLPNLTLVKSPKNATFNVGQQLSFTMVITNTGTGTAHIVTLNDPLPTTGGLTWAVTSITPPASGTCNISVSQVLSCTFNDVAPQASRTVVVTTNNVGGAPAASCTGSKLNNLATASTAGLDDVTDTGDYTCTPPTNNLKTATQGGWGSKPAGNNPGTILQNNFVAVFPAPNYLTIGGGCGGAFTLKFTSAAAVKAFLPQGSTPNPLTASAVNPTNKNLTVFAGQVLALQINVSFSGPVFPSGLGSFVLPSGPAAGKTVAQVLADANKALGGCGLPSYASSISVLNDIVTSINELFD